MVLYDYHFLLALRQSCLQPFQAISYILGYLDLLEIFRIEHIQSKLGFAAAVECHKERFSQFSDVLLPSYRFPEALSQPFTFHYTEDFKVLKDQSVFERSGKRFRRIIPLGERNLYRCLVGHPYGIAAALFGFFGLKKSKQIVYYSLALGHHLGVVDCLSSLFRVPYRDFESWVRKLPEGAGRRKLQGVCLWGEIEIHQSHVGDLTEALQKGQPQMEAQELRWTDWLLQSLRNISQEPALYLIVKSH